VVTDLQILGIVALVYIIAALSVALFKFKNIKKSFLRRSLFFFIFSIISVLIVIANPYLQYFYVLFTLSEFLFALTLYYNYLKTNLYIFSITPLLFFSYFEDILIILSIYFSFYITASILQSMFGEGKGSLIVLSSYLIMDASLVMQAFYILRLFSPFLTYGIPLFVISLMIFMVPMLKGVKK
jgi:hypothetical protein